MFFLHFIPEKFTKPKFSIILFPYRSIYISIITFLIFDKFLFPLCWYWKFLLLSFPYKPPQNNLVEWTRKLIFPPEWIDRLHFSFFLTYRLKITVSYSKISFQEKINEKLEDSYGSSVNYVSLNVTFMSSYLYTLCINFLYQK